MKNKIYKCEVCGNVVELLHEGGGELVCCGQPMKLQTEKNKDEGAEKHVPVIEKTESGYKVKIGSVPHPMEENHYIEWIELTAGDLSEKVFLKPGALPEAEFCITADEVKVRCYCNIHGLWTT